MSVCTVCLDKGTPQGCSECGYRDTSANDALANKLAAEQPAGEMKYSTMEELGLEPITFNYEYHRINCDCERCKAWWADASE